MNLFFLYSLVAFLVWVKSYFIKYFLFEDILKIKFLKFFILILTYQNNFEK